MLLCALLLDQSRKKLFTGVQRHKFLRSWIPYNQALQAVPSHLNRTTNTAMPNLMKMTTSQKAPVSTESQMQVPGRKLDHLYSKQLLKVKQCHQIKNVLNALKYLLRYDAESVGLMHSFVLHAFLLPIVQSIYFMLQRNGRLVNSTYNTQVMSC